MAERIAERLRARLEADLPDAFDKIFGHYTHMLDAPPAEDPKKIKEWLTNCRGALSQAEALLRMAGRGGVPPGAGDGEGEEEDIGGLLDEASRALAAFDGDDPPDEV